MNECNLPTRQQCFKLMEQFHVPSHIKEHGLVVAKLGVFLAKRLKEKGIAVNLELVDRACLLHDVLRVLDFNESDYDRFEQSVPDEHKTKWQRLRAEHESACHEEAAYELLKERYPVLATTIRRHKYTALLDEKEKPNTWEEKLVYYADKRVMRDKIVPLKPRLEEAHKRNALLREIRSASEIDTAKVDSLIFELEQEIFEQIGLDPLEITDELVNLRNDCQ
jgi:5'-deoxynucleotidase YfbR-like HD superfamily hydrolase